MLLRDFAEQLRQLRIATIANPLKEFICTNGNWFKAMETELYYELPDGLRVPSGMVQMFYADMELNSRSPEAQLMRAGIWEPYEAGYLIANIKGISIPLAKVTPLERRDMNEGWVTNSGQQLILRRKV